MTLMDTMNFNTQETLEQLRNGNTDVLKGLPPGMTLQLGMAMQKEEGDVQETSPIDFNEVTKTMVSNLKDGEVKAMLLKRIEDERKEK